MGILLRDKTTIYGLVDNLTLLQSNITDEATTRSTNDGDLSLLATTAKVDLVSAINEVLSGASSTAAGALVAANNLSDVADAGTSRTNLDVMSSAEVADAIEVATLAMGTNYNAADHTARDALTKLDEADRVFVEDDGDGKWALYKVGSVDENGSGLTWIKVADQDALEASISAPQIKAAYESNPDTNAFTDAEKVTLGYLSATGAIDLDDVILGANLNQDLSVGALPTEAVSAAAAKAYADNAAAAGGSLPMLEAVTVIGSDITLSQAPKGGIAGVMNFGTVRMQDVNGVSWDAPLIATADTKVWTISTDVTDEWDGLTVHVQYLYVTEAAVESGGGAL